MMRSTLYALAYWLITVVFALLCALLALAPGRAPLAWGLQRYGAAQILALKWIAGVRIEVRGLENLPDGASVIAAKHQSWGDAFPMLAKLPRLSFVCGDHLPKFPLVGAILKKIGAIVLSNRGGEAARRTMAQGLERLKRCGRNVLIYPEGRLAAPGRAHPYRKGVWHLYDQLKRPCTPVATNLGLAWDRQSFRKRAGRVTVEFLAPIEPGLSKETFMARLEQAIEARTAALVGEGLR